MKARIITTITTLVDLKTFASEHDVNIEDEDGVTTAAGSDFTMAAVLSAVRTTEAAILEQNPRLRNIDAEAITDEEERDGA
jgi:hypothetical protein